MSDLIDTPEMYLRTIYELVEEGVPPLRARIAERLKQSGPTVSETVARMERAGLVSVHPDRHLSLTAKGEEVAARVMRRHRLAECLLTDVIGLDWSLVHDEACRWEHVISTDVEQRLVQIMDHPTHSPYGNPIPALQELGTAPTADSFLTGVLPLSEVVADEEPHRVVLKRMGETIQIDPELLAKLAGIGVRPGRQLTAKATSNTLTLTTDSGELQLAADWADHLFVAAG
ncbi:MAG: metal-dependent transcriptional regulator [Propionibacteriaceae bacterium]|jgi:DtxR family Mn-dependent transcriptional regulator|nr:metal-dependent transcriptional regulator [Propionibacteriaceae bacterium]